MPAPADRQCRPSYDGPMRRPFPIIPRGPRRARSDRPREHLLACPRVSPEWELGALRALMKPQERGRILHRPAEQPWPPDAADRVEAARALVRDRLGYDPKPHLPGEGDYFLAASVPDARLPHAMAFSVVLSRALPGLWFVLGRLYVRDGRFFRRQRGFKLNLVPASSVHLPRAVRAAIRGS